MPQGSSGEWHTGEVVSLCESYGFIRKDGARPDIFMHYDEPEQLTDCRAVEAAK